MEEGTAADDFHGILEIRRLKARIHDLERERSSYYRASTELGKQLKEQAETMERANTLVRASNARACRLEEQLKDAEDRLDRISDSEEP